MMMDGSSGTKQSPPANEKNANLPKARANSPENTKTVRTRSRKGTTATNSDSNQANTGIT